MRKRLTDKRVVWVALCNAYLWEDNLADANTPPSYIEPDEYMKQDVAECKRRMAAFERVAQRYFGRSIAGTLNEPFKNSRSVDARSVIEMMKADDDQTR